MRTTTKDIMTLGNDIADKLNELNKTDIYSFDGAWGIVKKSDLDGISIAIRCGGWDRKNYERLYAIRDALCEINA